MCWKKRFARTIVRSLFLMTLITLSTSIWSFEIPRNGSSSVPKRPNFRMYLTELETAALLSKSLSSSVFECRVWAKKTRSTPWRKQKKFVSTYSLSENVKSFCFESKVQVMLKHTSKALWMTFSSLKGPAITRAPILSNNDWGWPGLRREIWSLGYLKTNQ